MRNLFNLFKKEKRTMVKIMKDSKLVIEANLSGIYNFDNTLKPIVLTIPKNENSISISDEDIMSMIQFIMSNYPDDEFKRSLNSLGRISLMYAIGKIPKIFADMTFDYVDHKKVEEGFQYFAVVILKGENNKAIGRGIFFNVVNEENIDKYFNKN